MATVGKSNYDIVQEALDKIGETRGRIYSMWRMVHDGSGAGMETVRGSGPILDFHRNSDGVYEFRVRRLPLNAVHCRIMPTGS